MLVVVRDVVCQHRLEMSSTDDQHAVQQLMTDCADPSLSHRIGTSRQLLVIGRVRKLGCG